MRYKQISRGERSMKMRMKSLCPFSSKRAMLELLGTAFFILNSSFFISCSDWDDHFDATSSVLDSQHASLWQNIEQNGNLTQFAALLRQAVEALAVHHDMLADLYGLGTCRWQFRLPDLVQL